jgi:hypothetical protein
MKVTNWRRKLMASLAAGGLIVPTAANAANLDTNLVANPGFETVDFGTVGDYGSPMVTSWLGGPGFAYSHNPTATAIPDYADGDDPPGAGDWYFTSNNNPGSATGDWRAPGLVYQDIDVSTGATGTQIATGEAAIKISAWMSSYLDDSDNGNVQVDFRNAAGDTLGSTVLSDPDFGPNNVWSRTTALGIAPVGTAALRVSVFGTPRNSGADGYIDEVDVQLTAAANELMFLEVNTTSGQVTMRNQTGDPVPIDYYEITSAGDALNATSWNSLQEQNLAGFPAGNGSGNGWEQFGGSSARAIGESYLTGSSSVANNASVSLGAAFDVGGARDLVFRYGQVASSAQQPTGDYNANGVVDVADFVVWRNSVGQNVTLPNDSTPGMVTPEDYAVWRTNFGNSGGPTGPGTLTTGFVRYVNAAVGASAAVPEPSTILMAGLGLGTFVTGTRRRTLKT